MRINGKIIFRQDGERAVLFDPDHSTVTQLNSTGVLLWKALAQGKDLPQLVDTLFHAYGEKIPQERLEADVRSFLGMLSSKQFLLEYGGPAVELAHAATSTGNAFDNFPFYERYSMKRVFVPGDLLETAPRALEEFVPGDIAVFYPHGKDVPGVVHRVLKCTPEGLITMGDNNPRPDEWIVSADYAPALVVARITPAGKRHTVTCGAAGMRQFRWNQFRRRIRSMLSRGITPFWKVMFWRKTLKNPVKLADQEQYYVGKKLVARRTAHGVEYFPFWNKLRYRVEKR